MKAHWIDDGSEINAARLNEEGVFYQACTTQPEDWQPALDKLKDERGYLEQDEVKLHPQTPDLENLCNKFIGEHFHDEDEVRFVLSGEGIFDIRSADDRWMRVKVERGDLIVVPEKRHHRFMLTDSKTIHCVRLFKDRTGWTPHYREESRSA